MNKSDCVLCRNDARCLAVELPADYDLAMRCLDPCKHTDEERAAYWDAVGARGRVYAQAKTPKHVRKGAR